MRLKKAEKKKYKQEIKDAKEQRIISLNAAHSVKWAWRELTDDHFAKLRLDLDHIGKYPIIDALEADCIDGETMFNTESYFKHYSNLQIRITLSYLKAAKQGISYIERLMKEELERRGHD